MKQHASLSFRVGIYREGKSWICQGVYRDICTQGDTREEAVQRWGIACRAEMDAVPTIVPADTPPGVRLMMETLHRAEFETLEVCA